MKEDNTIKTSHIVGYIIAVLLVSWGVQTLIFNGILKGPWVVSYMYIPAFLAFVFQSFAKVPWKKQLRPLFHRINVKSLAFSVVYPFFLLSIAVTIVLIFKLGSFNPDVLQKQFSVEFLITYLFMLATMLPPVFGEEYGWRGFLLPALTGKRGKLVATIIVGIVWGFWHIPSYYISYKGLSIGNPILLTTQGVLVGLVFAFALSYCYYLTENIIPCILLHGIYDITTASVIFGSPAIPKVAEGVPGLITMNNWSNVILLLFIVGLFIMPWFMRCFIKMDLKNNQI